MSLSFPCHIKKGSFPRKTIFLADVLPEKGHFVMSEHSGDANIRFEAPSVGGGTLEAMS